MVLSFALVLGLGRVPVDVPGRPLPTYVPAVPGVGARGLRAVELSSAWPIGGLGDLLWLVGLTAAVVLVAGGVATQVWRYRHVPLSSKRLARWNLAILVAIPAWVLLYPAVYGRFERGTSMAVFVWHQVHLTIYLAGPVLLRAVGALPDAQPGLVGRPTVLAAHHACS